MDNQVRYLMDDICSNCGKGYGEHIGMYCGTDRKSIFKKENEVQKMTPIFENEESARLFCKDCGFDADFFIERIKEKGYIKKSIVDEAIEMYNAKEKEHDTTKLEDTLYLAMMSLLQK